MINTRNRLLCIFLSIIMLLSMLPMSVFADTAAMINGGTGSYVIDDKGKNNPLWQSPPSVIDESIWGYRVSVRFAPMVGMDEDGIPIYDWTNSFQVGNTIYMREDSLGQTNGKDNIPAFSGSLGHQTSVYDLMVGNKTWYETRNVSTVNPFWYWIVPDNQNQNAIDESVLIRFLLYHTSSKNANSYTAKKATDGLNKTFIQPVCCLYICYL